MELLVISSPKKAEGEVADTIRMFENGLQRYHLRKPRVSKKYIKEFIELIPAKYRHRIVIHSNHNYAFRYKLGGIHISKKHRGNMFKLRLKIMWYRMKNPKFIVTRSCHKLGDLGALKLPYSYVFLSPVFDSISVNSLSAGFSIRGLSSALSECAVPVYAMGGTEPKRFQQIADLGFSGVAVLGYMWSAENRSEAFEQCLESWRSIR